MHNIIFRALKSPVNTERRHELSTHAALRKAYRKACTHISGQAWEHWTKGYVRLCHEDHARTRLALSFLKRSGLRRWRSAPRRSAEEIRLALEASDWQEITSVKWLLRRWRDAIARRRVTVHLIALFKRIQSFQYWQWRAQSKLRIHRMQSIAKHVAKRKARKKVLRRLRASVLQPGDALVLCGDFNSMPHSGVHELVSKGWLSPEHEHATPLRRGSRFCSHHADTPDSIVLYESEACGELQPVPVGRPAPEHACPACPEFCISAGHCRGHAVRAGPAGRGFLPRGVV